MDGHPSLEKLWADLHGLRDSLRGLHRLVEEENPTAWRPEDVPEPVQRSATDLADALGYQQEALAASADALGASRSGMDDWAVLDPLLGCHSAVLKVGWVLTGDFSSFRRYAELMLVTSDRRGAWPAWLRHVAAASAGCHEPYWEVHEQLRRCWADLAASRPRAAPDPEASTPAPAKEQ